MDDHKAADIDTFACLTFFFRAAKPSTIAAAGRQASSLARLSRLSWQASAASVRAFHLLCAAWLSRRQPRPGALMPAPKMRTGLWALPPPHEPLGEGLRRMPLAQTWHIRDRV